MEYVELYRNKFLGVEFMTERLRSIDTLRTMCILGVITIHTTAYINTMYAETLVITLLGHLFRFSVSTFALLSGFCLAYNYSNKPLSTGNFLYKQAVKLIPPYLLWYFIYQYYYTGSVHLPISYPFIKSLLLGTSASHLYFIPVLMGLYLIFPALWKYRSEIKKLLIISVLLQILMILVREFGFSLNAQLAREARGLFPLFGGYFVLGIFCAINSVKFYSHIKRYQRIYIATAISTFCLAVFIYPHSLTWMSYYLSSIPVAFILLSKFEHPLFNKIAVHSYGIYLVHYLILDYLVKLFPKPILNSSLLTSLVLIMLTFMISYFVTRFYYLIVSRSQKKFQKTDLNC